MPPKKTSQHGATNRILNSASSHASTSNYTSLAADLTSTTSTEEVTKDRLTSKRSMPETTGVIPAKRSRKQPDRFNAKNTTSVTQKLALEKRKDTVSTPVTSKLTPTFNATETPQDSVIAQMFKTMNDNMNKQIDELKKAFVNQHSVLQSQHGLINSLQTNESPITAKTGSVSPTASNRSKPSCPKYTTPAFSGVFKDDKIDFDSWVAKSKRFLKDWDVPETIKINATLMNISGPAIEILQARESEIFSVLNIYEFLKPHFQVIDKFRKLESIKQEGQGEESLQILGAKIRALCDATCTPETRESRALKYFVNALRPELNKKVTAASPVTLDQAIIQAKNFEEALLKSVPRKDTTTIQLAQIRQQLADTEMQADDSLSSTSNRELSHKQFEAIRKQISALSKDNQDRLDLIEMNVNNLNNRPNDRQVHKSYAPNHRSNNSPGQVNNFGAGCFYCGKPNHSFRKCFKASPEDIKQISKIFAERQKQQTNANENRLKAQSVKTASTSHPTLRQ